MKWINPFLSSLDKPFSVTLRLSGEYEYHKINHTFSHVFEVEKNMIQIALNARSRFTLVSPLQQPLRLPHVVSFRLITYHTMNLQHIRESFLLSKSLKSCKIYTSNITRMEGLKLPLVSHEQEETFFKYRNKLPLWNLSCLNLVETKNNSTETKMEIKFRDEKKLGYFPHMRPI